MAWLISVASALWSIWLTRNDVVSNVKVVVVNDILLFSKLRALMWIKVTPSSIMLCGEEKWWSDLRGCFMNGVLGFHNLLQIFILAGWASWCPLVLASDCKVLVNLIENLMQCPWALSKFFAEFDNLSSVCKLIQFNYIERVENEMAARLALDGFSRRDYFKAWW
ncbi:hypothetical protein V6N13_134315 [Hibiscus sabdariffa]